MMTPLLKDILKILDGIAPFSRAEEWDNPGFQVGFLSDKINKIFISLDPTIQALQKAGERNAQLLLTHHPLIFEGIKKIDTDAYPGDVVAEAIRSRISIVAVHTNLDIAKGGINDILSGMIGLQDVEALVKTEGSSERLDGLGRIGYLTAPMPLTAIARKIMEAVGAAGMMVMGDPDREIRKVAILGGSGGGELSYASEKAADLYITADIKHHEALMAQSLGLSLIDAGHFNMERAAMHAFADHLRRAAKESGINIVVETYEDEKAPMRYLAREG